MLKEETARSWLVLGLGVLVTAGIRAWLVSRVSTPWIFSDELVHSELAKGIADGSLFEVRGRHVNVTYAYPVVLAPAWLPTVSSWAADRWVDGSVPWRWPTGCQRWRWCS